MDTHPPYEIGFKTIPLTILLDIRNVIVHNTLKTIFFGVVYESNRCDYEKG